MKVTIDIRTLITVCLVGMLVSVQIGLWIERRVLRPRRSTLKVRKSLARWPNCR